MVCAGYVDWDDPESVPIFIQAFWPGLPVENKRRVHQNLRPFLPGTAEVLSQGNNVSTIQTATSLPRVQSTSASPTPSHQKSLSREPAKTVTTPELPLEKSIHASKPNTSSSRRCRRLPCAPGLSKGPLVTTSQQTCHQRSRRVAARTFATRSPAVSSTLGRQDSTKNLPHLPSDTIAELRRYSTKSLQSPSVARDIFNVARQLPEPYFSPLFSGADDDTKTRALEYAEAFFSKRGRSLQEAKNIVEKQHDDKSLVSATTKALRIHSMATVCLRDHLVDVTKRMPALKRLSPRKAKLKIVRARCRHFPNMKQSDVDKEITEELDHGAKYMHISKKFSKGLVSRLNHKCPSRSVYLSSSVIGIKLNK